MTTQKGRRPNMAPRLRYHGDRPLRVLAHVHGYPPTHNAGAEWMLHTMMRDLVDNGTDAAVLSDSEPVEIDGVRVERGTTSKARAAYAWADIVVTHLDRTRIAVRLTRAHRLPLVHIVHNDRQLAHNRVAGDPSDCALVVWNSRWIADAHPDWPSPAIIVRPPVIGPEYARPLDAGGAVTLVNLFEQKGGDLFYRLAESLPNVRFLGVRGSYGVQLLPPRRLGNVEVIPTTPRIADDVYARTRVLLMPSKYESWGRVAVEAMASGIPVIAAPTPGLLEALGSAGTFRELDDFDGWRRAIVDLTEGAPPDWYDDRSNAALERSAELTAISLADLATWREALHLAALAPTERNTDANLSA